MPTLETLIRLGAILHLGFLVAGGCLPRILDWPRTLAALDPLTRRLTWTYWFFTGLTLIGMALLAGLFPARLADGSPFSRSLCALMAGFWALRLAMGPFLPIKPYLDTPARKIGYALLNAAFLYLLAIYFTAALQ